MLNLSQQDSNHLASKGISPEDLNQQLNNFEKGFPFANIVEAATVENGITRFTPEEMQQYVDLFDQRDPNLSILKFVPASGAASRMFKDLVGFQRNPDATLDNSPSMRHCFMNLGRFAFVDKLRSKMRKYGADLDELLRNGDYKTIASYILSDEGLKYQRMPKAMLYFHKYADGPRTPFAEHLVEGARYAVDASGKVRLNFTISPEHRPLFEAKLMSVVPRMEQQLGVHYDIQFTEQKSKTDMVALDANGQMVRTEDGNILFRPGGHGALIENLNECDADVVFIKNIDNVTVDSRKEDTYRYKKALAGYLLSMQAKIADALAKLDELSVSDMDLAQIEGLASHELHICAGMSYFAMSTRQKVAFLQSRLNRPVRVCGMVKNLGEPGGGPFWVKDQEGHVSLQILETAQINMKDAYQANIAQKATHFNPVDLVCGLRNYRGNKFNLKSFVDPSTGFISSKTQNGIDMKIQELPGLWNGAMANWITLFVEVPVTTFTPVKTLEDLLRPEHQEL